MAYWTEYRLSQLDRQQLVVIAAAHGILPTNKANAVLIGEILMRQGEAAGRAVVPEDLRLIQLEDNQARLEVAVLDTAGAIAGLIDVLQEERGRVLTEALGLFALKYKGYMPEWADMTRIKRLNRRQKRQKLQGVTRLSWAEKLKKQAPPEGDGS